MKNAIILHGNGNTPDGNWFPWLKKQLEKNGHEVWVPQLPNSEMPNAKDYNELLLGHGFNFNKDTILVGHSSGAVSILNLLQELPTDIKIKAAYLIGAFEAELGVQSRTKLFPKPFEFERIKSHCGKFIFIHSDNDPYCPLKGAKFLAEKLDGALVVEPGQGHFNLEASPKYNQFPKLLSLIDKTLGNT